ncbi:MAG: tRNA (adenosine(37)-N6)-threonylcarbamoyltransferase complex dimerization subunit type 1 TsaB, partial [Bacteroidota bacterium]
AIKDMLVAAEIKLKDIHAVAVAIGPGSYTGLRIGLSTAKGLCYALNIPLIAIGTLDMMAEAAIKKRAVDLYCPMIDARRMEVFTAVYKRNMEKVIEPCAMIIDENSFSDLLKHNSILFYGNGSNKLKLLVNNREAFFDTIEINASELVKISNRRFRIKDFSSTAYTDPVYIKQFYTPIK